MYRKKLAKIANELGFVWTDEEGFADFKFLLGPKWAVKLRDIVRGVLLHRAEYPSDRLAVREYAEHYERIEGQEFKAKELATLMESAPDATLVRAIWLFARKVWNGSEGRYCESAWELRELADLRCFPGVPF